MGRKRSAPSSTVPNVLGFGEEVDERSYVQALRANPPGLASGDHRRAAVFGAALQQFDELLVAASAVGPASAPLPLFYALSQAGRAIAAARMSDNTRWAFTGHGLAFAANRADPGRSTVSPKVKSGHKDAYSVVADATNSASISAPVEVASLWASLPWLDVAPGWGEGLPRALIISPQQYGLDATEAELRLPDALHATIDEREQAFTDRLSAYPGTDRFEVVRWDVAHLPVEDRDEGIIVVRWVDDSRAPVTLHSIAVTYLSDMALYLWPGVGTNADVLSPLMTWWALLYGLSHLARYEPAAWTRMLDRDRSALGVPIERGLRYVRTVMPRLVLHALTDSWQMR